MPITQPANSPAPNPVAAALDAFKAGQDPLAATYGGTEANASGATPSDGPTQPEEASLLDAISDGTEGPAADATPAEGKPVAKAKPASKDVEEVVVTDEHGRRRIRVDYSDREAIKRNAQIAAGAGKFKADKDRAERALKEVQPELNDLRTSWKAIEEGFARDGILGIAEVLGGKGAGEKFAAQLYEARRRKEDASPSELKQIEMEEALTRERKERERLARTVEQQLKDADARKAAAEERMLQSRVEPVFEAVRFAGKLGDADAEAQLDSAMWDQVIKRLGEYPEDVELTPALIRKEFSEAAAKFSRVIQRQADTKTKQTLQAKKQAATESAAAAATSGMARSSEADAFRNNIKSGRIVDAFKQFASGKVRL